MKKIFITLFLGLTLLSANKVYDLSGEDYEKYKKDPKQMIENFKNKFLHIKKEEKVKKVINKTKVEKIKKTTLVKKELPKNVNNPLPPLKQKEKKIVKIEKIDTKKKVLKPIKQKKKKTVKVEKKQIKKEIKKAKIIKNNKKNKVNKKLLVKKNNYKKIEQKPVKMRPVSPKKEKVNKLYSFTQVNKKLNYYKIKSEKNMDTLIKSINKILKDKDVSYDEKEISMILRKIKANKLSTFESQIYIEQIASLVKG